MIRAAVTQHPGDIPGTRAILFLVRARDADDDHAQQRWGHSTELWIVQSLQLDDDTPQRVIIVTHRTRLHLNVSF